MSNDGNEYNDCNCLSECIKVEYDVTKIDRAKVDSVASLRYLNTSDDQFSEYDIQYDIFIFKNSFFEKQFL